MHAPYIDARNKTVTIVA